MKTILTDAITYYGGIKSFAQHVKNIKNAISNFHTYYTPDVDIYHYEISNKLIASYDCTYDFFDYYLYNILIAAYELKEDPILTAWTFCIHENSHRNDPTIEEDIEYRNDLIGDNQLVKAKEVEYELEVTARNLGIQFIQHTIDSEHNPFHFDQAFLELFHRTQAFNLKAYRTQIEEVKEEQYSHS